MLAPILKKNDKQARWLIITVSFIVFAAVVVLGRVKLDVDPGFDIHIFAKINAFINSTVSVLLILALVAVRKKQYLRHRNMMTAAILLSVLFLVSYIAHHLLAGETKFGDSNGDGVLDAAELAAAGGWRTVYYIILPTHIVLAAIVLPFILFTAYRALTGEFDRHKKLARYSWPLWLYVSISGVLVYLFISPYYG